MRHIESVTVDFDLLGEVGRVPYTAAEAREALDDIRTTLDERILARLTPAMSASQRQELELLRHEGAVGAVERFLDRQMPGHREVAEEELAALASELAACATIDRILVRPSPISK